MAFGSIALGACIVHVSSRESRTIVVSLPRPPEADASGFAVDASTTTARTCDDVKREVLARAAELTEASIETFTGPDALLGTCLDTPEGRWVVTFVEDPETLHEPDFAFHLENDWRVRFEPTKPATGPAAELTLTSTLSNYGERKAHPPQLFDFDGDGVPELFLATDEDGDEGHHARQVALLTYREGRVERYLDHLDGPKDAQGKSALTFDSLADADGDGRPDLVTYAGYTHSLESCASGFPSDFAEPRFVLHSLKDGRFSADDDAAKAYARRFCPNPKSVIASSEDAICARLWAKDAKGVAKARARVVGSCLGQYCDYLGRGKKPPTYATPDCERRLRWFDLPPPLTLP